MTDESYRRTDLSESDAEVLYHKFSNYDGGYLRFAQGMNLCFRSIVALISDLGTEHETSDREGAPRGP